MYVQVKLYGVHQGAKTATSSVFILARKTTDILAQTSSATTYIKFTITDPVPNVLISNPIEITHF